jgi:hypothetical protein
MYSLFLLFPADLIQSFITVHDRHLDIHQYQIKPALLKLTNTFSPMFYSNDAVPQLFEQRYPEFRVDRVILNKQYS